MARIPPPHPTLDRGAISAANRAGFPGALEPKGASLQLTYNGRAAIYQYFSALRASSATAAERNVVLLPAFHCPTLVDPILHAGYQPRFYAIDRQLQVADADLLSKLAARDVTAVLFVRFFGLTRISPALISACRARDVRIVEDCAHSFLEGEPPRLADTAADALVFSFWKLAPSLVGGGALTRDSQLLAHWPKRRAPSVRDSAARLRTLAGQLWPSASLPRFVQWRSPPTPVPQPVRRASAREAYPYDSDAAHWRMPWTARRVLERTDFRRVMATRRANYQLWAQQLAGAPLIEPSFPELSVGACPWGFPLYLPERAARDYLLRASGVPLFTFGEVLHPLLFELHAHERTMLEAARDLADNLLVFACHQGLCAAQIETAASAARALLAEWAAG